MTEKLLFIHIQQDPAKRISPERIHEQEVAVYDLLDENQFDVLKNWSVSSVFENRFAPRLF